MSSIFPIREKVTLNREPEPRLVDLDEEIADEVFEALASTTTRKIFLELHNQPQTASDLAEVTDTSVQNIQYHLEKLTDVELVEVVDTWYSERGSEMKVYAPQDESLVLFAGRDKQSAFKRLVDRFAGVFALLVPPSILAGWIANRQGTAADDGVRTEYAMADDDTAAPDDSVDEATDSDDAPADEDVVDDDSGDQIGASTADDGEDTPAPEPEETPAPDEVEDTDVERATDDLEVEATGAFDTETVQIEVEDPERAAELAAENETVYLVVEGSSSSDIFGIDPSVTLAFFLGGLIVYGAFVMRRRTF